MCDCGTCVMIRSDAPYVMSGTIEIKIKKCELNLKHRQHEKKPTPLYSNTNQLHSDRLHSDRLGFVQIGLWPE